MCIEERDVRLMGDTVRRLAPLGVLCLAQVHLHCAHEVTPFQLAVHTVDLNQPPSGH